MVLRCYSRRNLLPSFKPDRSATRRLRSAHVFSRSAATSAAAHLDQNTSTVASTSTAASAPPPHQPQGLRESAASPLSQRDNEPWSFFSPRTAGWKQEREHAQEKHPLVRKLMAEVYSVQRVPAANRVWRAYNAVREANVASGDSRATTGSLMNQLAPVQHQLVLRAIDPDVARSRKVKRLKSKCRQLEAELVPSSSSSGPDAAVALAASAKRRMLANTMAKAASKDVFDADYSVREYLQRVNIIFREMRLLSYDQAASSTAGAAEVQPMPDVSDYNHVLAKLSRGGHLGSMSALWNQLNALSDKNKGDAAGQRLSPTRTTYKELMVGLSKHAMDQIERVQKHEASRAATLMGKRNVDRSVRAAAAGLAKWGQVLAPSARGAAILAALRTMALLDDMRDHGARPDHLTLDLAARTLRLAGHIDGLKLLMKEAYGIDLAAPGARDASRSVRDIERPTVHTLNTILMALGEQATVPEMIAAYETISRPTPIPASDAATTASAEDQGSLFAINWKDLIRSVRERNAADQESEQTDLTMSLTSDTLASTHAGDGVSPNTKSFEVMIRHCCLELDPLRSPATWPQATQGRPVNQLVKEATETTAAELAAGGVRASEMQKRSNGDYILFARYLIQNALEMTQRHVQETAERLGFAILPDAESAVERGAPELVPALTSTAETQEPTSSSPAEPGVIDNAAEAAQSQEAESAVTEGEEEVPHYAPSVSATRALEPGFLPLLLPTSLSITPEMVAPFISLVSQKKNIKQLRWIREVVSQALTAELTHSKVFDAAWRLYYARLVASKQAATAASEDKAGAAEGADDKVVASLSLKAEQLAEVYDFLNQLRKLGRRSTRQAQKLDKLLYERLDDRIATLSQRRKAQQVRHKQRVRTALEEEAARQQAEAERAALKKAQAAEAKRLRELRRDEEADPASTANLAATGATEGQMTRS